MVGTNIYLSGSLSTEQYASAVDKMIQIHNDCEHDMNKNHKNS